jgi:integrase
VAREMLGHSDISITQNIYTHVFDDAKRDAADAMDRLFAGSGEITMRAS